MNTRDIAPSLGTLLAELLDGAPTTGAYMLNRGDAGLLQSLDKLDAAAASRIHAGGASIAAHVDHVRYGLSLFTAWAAGHDPWANADWAASWRKTSVSEADWSELRAALRDQARRWSEVVRAPRDVNEIELNGVVGSIAHIAYHLGAIRQMDRAARGPSADEEAHATRSRD